MGLSEIVKSLGVAEALESVEVLECENEKKVIKTVTQEQTHPLAHPIPFKHQPIC